MKRVLRVEIDCGELTCAKEVGKFCRFYGRCRMGTRHVCLLWPSEEAAWTQLEETEPLGRLLRCQACLDAEKGEV